MTGPDRRQFTILDLMALVAALAVGIAAAQGYRAVVLLRLARPQGLYLYDRTEAGAGFLMAGSVVLLALRMVPPRPRWRRVARQPGAIASLSATVVLLIGLPIAFVASWRPWPTGGEYMTWVVLFTYVPKEIGAAIAATWAVAAMSGCWRPEPTWIDRAGRALGAAWVAYLVVQSILEFLIL